MALTMRISLAVLFITCFVIAGFGGINVSGDGEPSLEIGRYERVTGSGDLTSEHVEDTAAGFRVEGPLFTDTLRVAEGFLQTELGDGWAADEPFVLEDGDAIVAGRSAEFSPLEIGSSAVFTMGSRDQVQFQERPMWVSAQQDELGATITLDMDDGDSSGQEVFIAKQWLWERGIHRPVVVHEDGTELSAVPTQQRDGWVVDMHHFSYVEISPAELVVFSRQEGLVVPHTGEVRWYEEEQKLEIDVGGPTDCGAHVTRTCSSIDQDVLVDKDWLDMRIDDLALHDHPWVIMPYEGDDYYQVNLTSEQTPTTIVFEQFAPGPNMVYTRGSPESVVLYAVNGEYFRNTTPMMIEFVDTPDLEISVERDRPYLLQISDNWLGQLGISSPSLMVGGRPQYYYQSHDNESWLIDLQGKQTIQLRNGDRIQDYQTGVVAHEAWLKFEGTLVDVYTYKFAYLPFIGEEEGVQLNMMNVCDLVVCNENLSLTLKYLDDVIETEVTRYEHSSGLRVTPILDQVPEWEQYLLSSNFSLEIHHDGVPDGENTQLPILAVDDGLSGAVPPHFPLPEFNIKEPEVLILLPEQQSQPIVANKFLYETLIPNSAGQLAFTAQIAVEGLVEPGDDLFVKVDYSDGTHYIWHDIARGGKTLVTFESLPAWDPLAIFTIQNPLGEWIEFQPFELGQYFPAGSGSDCGETSIDRRFGDYHRDWEEGDFTYEDRVLGWGGWTYIWDYRDDCEEHVPYLGGFGFSFKGPTRFQAGSTAKALEFSGVWEADGMRMHQPPDGSEPYWPSALAWLGYTDYRFKEPTSGNIQFFDSTVQGRAPDEANRPQNCDLQVLVDVLLSVATKIPFLGLINSLFPDAFCVARWTDEFVMVNDEVWREIEIREKTYEREYSTGHYQFKFHQAAGEIPLDLIARMEYRFIANACPGCPTAVDDHRNGPGAHYYLVQPTIQIQ